MTALELSPTQAWTAGARMWIAPSPIHSLWSRKLDWYLNFRISKGLTHQAQPRSEQLEAILSRIEWKIPAQTDITEKPLLIASGLWLPCDWLLILEDFANEKTNIDKNLEKVARAWSDLGEPALRLFAPSQLSRETVSHQWSKHDLPKEFEFVGE